MTMNVYETDKLPIKIWGNYVEPGALAQLKDLAIHPFAEKWVCAMPDCHQGYGMPIGGVLATRDVVIPNAVGVDIGCGMVAAKTSLTDMSVDVLKFIMGEIRTYIPVGFAHNELEQEWDGFDNAPDIPVIRRELLSARKQLGTLGGGNHFIEIQKGNDGHIWVMIHSGSRNFGLQVATTYHNIAKRYCDMWASDIPNVDLAFLPIDIPDGKEYLAAMQYCVDFALANRAVMKDKILATISALTGATEEDEINIAHNYAAWENHYGQNYLIHRKGATKATAGLRGIIPGSMGTSSYIVEGLGNPESFMSCSHGAGRRMGRKDATRTLDLAEQTALMSGVIHGLRTVKDLDEAPGAYKDIDEVMESQKDLVRPLVTLTPLANIKG